MITDTNLAEMDFHLLEQFDSAVEEYSSSLSILSQILPPSDRQLSEQHMLIALASEFLPQGTGLTRAVSHAEKAKSVLVLRVSELEAKSEADKSDKDKKEIENIRELLGDVDNKVSSTTLLNPRFKKPMRFSDPPSCSNASTC